MRRLLADWFNHKGNQAADAAHPDRAIEFYKKSAKADPTWSTPHFNLGLQAKFAANWHQSLEHNQRAVQLNPTDQGAWWNLGIAATALRDWPQARQAWRNAGIDVPQREGECTWASPAVACARINPAAAGEVVWGQRIDPARIQPPLPRHRPPRRRRQRHPILARHRSPSLRRTRTLATLPYATFQVTAHTEICLNRVLGFEDCSSSHPLCKQCSQGTPGQHRLAIAAQSQSEVEQAIEEWQRTFPTAPPAQIELLLPAPQSNAKIT